MSSESPEFLLGDRNGAHLRLRPLHRDRPGLSDYWDGNWIMTDVRIAAGGFSGRFRANLRVEELQGFRSQLAGLYGRLTGEAALNSCEGWLHVVVAGDGRGHLQARCEASDDPAIGNRLRFLVLLDQSYLPGALRGLDAILGAYPAIGR